MRFPQWATPERRTYLAELFLKYGNTCLKGHRGCTDVSHYLHQKTKAVVIAEAKELELEDKNTGLPNGLFLTVYIPKTVRQSTTEGTNLYFLTEDNLVEEWKRDDRDGRSYERRLEERRLHSAPNKKIRRGKFDSIRREQFLADRPIFLVVGIGVNAFTQRRVAKVEIPGLEKVIWVDLSGVEVSKNRLRKLSRRPGGKIPEAIHSRIQEAVRRYFN